MGIEDFSVDSQDHADRILIIGGTPETASRLVSVLKLRRYVAVPVASPAEAAKAAVTELFDLIIIDHQHCSGSPKMVIDAVRTDAYLRRFPMLVICGHGNGYHPEQDAEAEVAVLPAPFEPSSFLVKVATQLRLRKTQFEQARFEARITAQNAELRDLTNRFQQELREARQIQHSILPKNLPQAPHTGLSAYYMPFEEVGGDLFDIWKLDAVSTGLFIADVTGHGLPAAFIGAMTKMALAYAPKDDPAIMLAHINTGLTMLMPEGRFVTAAAAFYNAGTRTLSMARAGHPLSYIWRAASGAVEQISPRGIALGIADVVKYELFSTVLEPGDKLLMVTDGVTETMDMDGRLWGTDQVGLIFGGAASGQHAAECIQRVVEAQQQFAGGRVIRDDITMLALECLT